MSFSYVNVVTKGCEGWLNLFFDEYCVTLINNVYVADKIRKEIPKKYFKLAEPAVGIDVDKEPCICYSETYTAEFCFVCGRHVRTA